MDSNPQSAFRAASVRLHTVAPTLTPDARVTVETYPSAKQIRRSASGFDVVDLLYDNQDTIKVLKASDSAIEFSRTARWSGCSAYHRCGLDGERQLLCTIETKCPQAGGERVVWKGEERYERRTSCERTQARPEAQGIPSVCR